MTPNEIAAKAAEEVMGVIERNKRIVKAEIAEVIEGVLLTSQPTPSYGICLDRPPANLSPPR